MQVRLEALPADVLGLSDLERRVWSGRPVPDGLGGLTVPARLEHVARRPGPEDPALLERVELAAALRARLEPLEPHPAVLEAADSLADPDSALVVCGQQPGLFGGPLLCAWKALHAVRLAAALRERWGTPVRALFWNHADDHDLAEVNHAQFLTRHLDLARVGPAGLGSGRRPLSRVVLDAETHRLGAVEERLRQLLPEGPHRDPALALFLPRAGESLAGAFTRTLTRLFGAHGLLVLEPDWIRPQLTRALARTVAAGPLEPLRAAGARLAAHGLPQAIDPETAALVYRVGPEGRDALRPAPDAGANAWRYDGEDGSRSGEELAAELAAAPEAWSAGALLRPLVQDRCLPTVAYVGGPGELAYHAQLPELRAATGAPAPAFVPRASVTLVSAATRRALERLELGVVDALRARGSLAAPTAVEAADLPPAVRALLDQVARLREELRELRPAVAELDRGLAAQLRRAADRAAEPLERIAEKLERVHRNRAGKERRHERRVANVLTPRGSPQERVLTTLQYAATFGTDWLDAIAEGLDPLPSEPLAAHLDSAGEGEAA